MSILQARYLFNYLQRLEHKPYTIVIEQSYVDGDYLAEYANFYASVFARFDRFCRRVHFFSHEFDEEAFRRIVLREENAKALTASYLGFVVARPLPEAIVGRTLVVTYPEKAEHGELRRFKAVTTTKVNLFGIKLEIKESLPFQQQDQVNSACAQVSLWSAFHATANLFGSAIPRPTAITIAATQNTYERRTFPTYGLNVDQISGAIRANGLEPEVFREGPKIPVLSWLRGYLEMGLPVILGLNIERAQRFHAVVVVGYRLSETSIKPEVAKDYRVYPAVGRRIDELYCHDDNLGPFAAYPVLYASDKGLRFCVKDYALDAPSVLSKILTVESVVVPVYHKIRLPFPAVHEWVTLLDAVLEKALNPKVVDQREWDIRLRTNIQLKEELALLPRLSSDQRFALLTQSEPRFLWVMSLNIGKHEILRIHADATAFERSMPLRNLVLFDRALQAPMLDFLGEMTQVSDQAQPLRRFLAGEMLEKDRKKAIEADKGLENPLVL